MEILHNKDIVKCGVNIQGLSSILTTERRSDYFAKGTARNSSTTMAFQFVLVWSFLILHDASTRNGKDNSAA